MPRGNEDWSLGKIYRIISNNPEITVVYFGSTVQSLCRRMASHRGSYKAWCSGKAKPYSIFPYFKQYGIEQFHIELVQDFSCDNEQQLLTQENVYIRGFECCNKHWAIRTPEEVKQQRKQRYQDNKETIIAKAKQYYEDNFDVISIKKKQRSLDNAESIAIYQKQYRQDHAEQIITCVCGCQIRKDSLRKHLKSKKHLSLVQT